MATNFDKYRAAGAEVLGVSVDPAEKSLKMSEQLKLPFPVLSDVGHRVIDQYAILDKGGQISVAAVFVVDKQGMVRWSYVADDYKIRPLDETVLHELNKLK
jgi:thioredoxin-dependent peroxiredoxin